MSNSHRTISGWVPSMVLGAWAGTFAYLLISFRYMEFLRPDFGLLLLFALIISLGFTAACLPGRGAGDVSSSVLLRLTVLLLPVFFLLLTPRDTLKSYSFKTRFTGVSGLSAAVEASTATFPPPPETDKSGKHELTISSLYRKADQYQGQQVTFTGMVLRDETLKPYFGGRDTAVYRFLISCCIADAIPLAISVDEDLIAHLADDEWVQVEGVFRIVVTDDQPFPLIEGGSVTPIDAPGFQYLF